MTNDSRSISEALQVDLVNTLCAQAVLGGATAPTPTSPNGETFYALRRGEVAVLLRALRMYMAEYQRMVGEERDPSYKEDLRQHIRAAGAVFAKMHPSGRHPHAPQSTPGDPIDRSIHLGLTRRYAGMLLRLCRKERDKQRKQHDPNFTPEPGKYDSHLMRATAMEDLMRQIESQGKWNHNNEENNNGNT